MKKTLFFFFISLSTVMYGGNYLALKLNFPFYQGTIVKNKLVYVGICQPNRAISIPGRCMEKIETAPSEAALRDCEDPSFPGKLRAAYVSTVVRPVDEFTPSETALYLYFRINGTPGDGDKLSYKATYLVMHYSADIDFWLDSATVEVIINAAISNNVITWNIVPTVIALFPVKTPPLIFPGDPIYTISFVDRS